MKLRKYCPHCGSKNVHTMTAYPFDKRRVVYFCGLSEHSGIAAGCGWVWCKPFDLWLMGKSLQDIEENGGIMLFDYHFHWEEIHRCSCGWIGLSSEAKWIQLNWTPKGVLSEVCPKCGKHGMYVESYKLDDNEGSPTIPPLRISRKTPRITPKKPKIVPQHYSKRGGGLTRRGDI